MVATPPVNARVREAAESAMRASQQVGKAAFVARALRAVAQMASEMDERTLSNAAGAPSDLLVLAEALQDPGVSDLLRQEDPLLPSKLRGIRARQELLDAEGGTVSAAEMAALLGISRQAVDKRRRAGTLLAVPIGEHRYAYAVWQLNEHGGVLEGLSDVLAAFDDVDPWMRFAFMLGPRSRLQDATPLQALRAGRVGDVVQAAHMFGQHLAP